MPARSAGPMRDDLAVSYRYCRDLHRRHGRSYYLATMLLPEWKRRHVHALYGFARYADEIVDAFDGAAPELRARRLRALAARFGAGLPATAGSAVPAGPAAPGSDPAPGCLGAVSARRAAGPTLGDPDRAGLVLPAVWHTIAVFGLDPADFTTFLDSMAMDLTVRRYPTYADLLGYMAGSAAAIGTMMLPLLAPRDPAAAREPARQLGLAFQLTNFIRDVAEDLARDRVYLPLADLERFGVRECDLRRAVRAGRGGPAIRDLVAFEVARARAHYAAAWPGIVLLPPRSQACVRAAHRLYGGILDEVAAGGYEVLGARVRVPRRRRAVAVVSSLLAAAVRSDGAVPAPR